MYATADRITILCNGKRLLTQRLIDITPVQIAEGIVSKKMEFMDSAGQSNTGGSLVL